MAVIVMDSTAERNRDAGVPTIGVMVLNQNGERWLGPLFDSLRQQSYPKLKVYLVDNASVDRSVSLTKTDYPEVKILQLSRNAGYCMAYNITMPVAFSDGCEWVIWANNDVLLEPDCLRELGSVAGRYERVGVVGPAFICWDSKEPNYYMKGNHPEAVAAMQTKSRVPIEVNWVEGSFLMVSRECIKQVGWLDPFLFFNWEETDFCRRAIRSNWRVVLAPGALARHYAGGWSAENNANATTANYLKSRNQYIYALANPSRSFFRNLFDCIHLFLVLVKSGHLVSRDAAFYEIRAFLRLIPEYGKIWHKWRRDKDGFSPAATTTEFANINIEIAGS